MMKEPNTKKPELLKQNDIVSFYHIQLPRWLFADNRYNHISLAAKVAYALLLNRYQLSRLNGWINDAGEVYVIFPREELAAELQVGARKAIEVFKELTDAGLVWETRRGNNKANLIYLTRVELSREDGAAHDSAPFTEYRGEESGTDAGAAESAGPDSREIEGDEAETPARAL
ncbi:MAG: replication initiator protein A, partial [Oscillospiraceae bacterium]|nr:replication initiator protein A [Oscillospiraceae bacterium]